jgi:hypothetical protein
MELVPSFLHDLNPEERVAKKAEIIELHMWSYLMGY